MIEIDPELESDLRTLFQKFDDQNIRYVVLRGYEMLFDQIPGNDIDILIHPDDIATAEYICNIVGFEKKAFWIMEVVKFGKVHLLPVKKGILQALRHPKKYLSLGYQAFRGGSVYKLNPPYHEMKRFAHGTMLHGYDRLVYKYPSTRDKIPVSNEVTKSVFDHRRKRNDYWVPSAVDELLHLICRCVFDHQGVPPKYYHEMIKSKAKMFTDISGEVQRFLQTAECIFGRRTYEICAPILNLDPEEFVTIAKSVYTDWQQNSTQIDQLRYC